MSAARVTFCNLVVVGDFFFAIGIGPDRILRPFQFEVGLIFHALQQERMSGAHLRETAVDE